ncbi:MAG: FAD assembly factor SdhE [Gammaproteobacteria bacterium]|jgi:antitoxin CptB
MSEKSRLTWRCRRGMREMDILFEKFLQNDYDNLSQDNKVLFDNFLNEADVDIYSWITGNSTPETSDYNLFIKRLQETHN